MKRLTPIINNLTLFNYGFSSNIINRMLSSTFNFCY